MPPPDSPPRMMPVLPLQGVTILLVEDSRYASEALRLTALRLGARLRRAETLAAARWHLATYRPDVLLVDMGLPDGSGAELIAELAGRGLVAIALSGDPGQRGAALAAGAREFLEKPLGGVAAFQALIARHLPDLGVPARSLPEPEAEPDPLALHEDLLRAAALLGDGPNAAQRAYLARFLAGIARASRDVPLRRAAMALGREGAPLDPLARLVAARIGRAPAPFA